MTPRIVYAIQQKLNMLGFRVPVSGSYDLYTRNVITEIQMRLHITPDGELNPNTVQAIMEAGKPVRVARPQVVRGSYTAQDAPTFKLPKPKTVLNY